MGSEILSAEERYGLLSRLGESVSPASYLNNGHAGGHLKVTWQG